MTRLTHQNRLLQCLAFTCTYLLFVALSANAQTEPESVPVNAYLADSTWPLFHRNGYAQASGAIDAIKADERLSFQRLDNPNGGTAPWTVVAAPYSDGSQAVISNTQFGVIKWLIDGDRFEEVSYLQLPRGRFDFDWNIAALSTGEFVVTSIKDNRFYLLKDTQPDCPQCELLVNRQFNVPRSIGDLTIHFSISFDGHILVLLEGNRIAAISLDSGDVVGVKRLAEGETGYSYHNAFATDESGRIFVSSQNGVTALDWNGAEFELAWTARYDFRGPSCRQPRRQSRFRERMRTIRGKRCTGTGTTPSLLGDGDNGIVLMVDGHAPQNNLVAFWRSEIPSDWEGYPGEERRLAGKIALPLSTPEGEGYTAENSPAVLGASIFIAQWAGFNPDCSPPKGVQRVDWDPFNREFKLIWANPDAHFNGIPTVSSITGLVYGTGRGNGCTYAYRGLSVETGAIEIDLPLGDENVFTDQGNQQAIADDGSIIIGVRKGTLRILAATEVEN